MGILNVTPDSFYDGGHHNTTDDALFKAEAMLMEGATIIDIGGESSRPAGATYGEGALALGASAEMERVLPVIEALSTRFPEAVLSIDTYKPEVARQAVARGVSIINDITGLRLFPEMASVAADAGTPLILMHALGAPGAMPHEHQYDDVVAEVASSLRTSIQIAEAAGVSHIITDPGFGFGKSASENLSLMNHTATFVALGYPVLVGISRKSTIGRVLQAGGEVPPPAERLYGTLGATAAAVLRGASIVRVHDVRATVEMLKGLHAVERGL